MPREDWPQLTPENIFNGHYPKGTINGVLDVGCGLSVKSQFMSNVNHIVALDIYEPYLEQARRQAERDDIIYMKHDARQLSDLFLPRSFDIVLLQDVIEHFEKHQALDVIAQAEAIARRAVIINTPHGFFKQDIDTWGMGGDYWQMHRSGWSMSELDDLGYHVQARQYRVCDVIRTTDGEKHDPEILVIDAIKVLS